MPAIDDVSRDQNELMARLRSLLGHAATDVGTPFPEALAAVLKVDRRLSGSDDGLKRQRALSDAEIYNLAEKLNFALANDTEVELPLGSIMKGTRKGAVAIDEECLVLDAGRAGLFALEMTPQMAHGPNLELLRSEIKHITRNLACRRIGLPCAVERFHGDVRSLLQFPPLKDAKNVVLQRSAKETGAARFCAASQAEIKALAKDITLDMRALWSKRKAIAEQVQRVRLAAESATSEAGSAMSVGLIAIDMKNQRNEKTYSLYVEYEAIDETMSVGPVPQYVPANCDLSSDFQNIANGVDGRREKLAKLKATGAEAWIDDVALSVLRATPDGMTAVLGKLSKSYETVVEIAAGNKPLYATLYWRDGCIRAKLTVPGQLTWAADSFFVDVCIPETAAASLVGQSLASIVTFPLDLQNVIVDAENLKSKQLRLGIDNKKRLISLTSGEVWSS